MKKTVLLLFFSLFINIMACAEVVPVATHLAPRLPEWHPNIVENYEDGSAKVALFMAENEAGEKYAVKRLHFAPGGKVSEEIDLITVAEDSEAAKTWQSTSVPHGLRVYFSDEGRISKVACYDQGILHGPFTEYFAHGEVMRNLTFDHGLREGKAIINFEDGVLAEEGTFSQDLPVGETKYYYPTGNRKCTVPHKEGKVDGLVINWYEEGSVHIEENYVDGLLHSDNSTPAVVAYFEDGAIQEIKHFEHGKENGLHTSYYANGQERTKNTFVNGLLEGDSLLFSEQGKLIGKGLYQNGLPIGKHYRNHISGELAYIAHYDKEGNLTKPIEEFNEKGACIARYSTTNGNVRDGQFQIWYDNGQIEKDYCYVNGQFEGKQLEYFDDGSLRRVAHYENFKKQGEFKEFAPNGQLIFSMNFDQGEPVGDVREWFESGLAKIEKQFKEGKLEGADKEWFENGNLRLDALYVNGELNGPYKAFSEAGHALIEGQYENGLAHGDFTTRYEDGAVKEKLHFDGGKKNGPFESFYPNGQKQATGQYLDDQPHGELLGWYDNGCTAFKRQYLNGEFVGTQTEYFPAQKGEKSVVSKVMLYSDHGVLDGEQKTHYPSGIVQSVITYNEGQLHGMKALWDENGDLIEEAWYEQDKLEGRFFERDKQGKEVIAFYENNKKEGPYEAYYPQNEQYGKVKALEATYRNNQLVGNMFEYDQTGAKRALTSYVNGKKQGICKLFIEGEKVVLECPFENDMRHGKCIQYYASGKVHKEQEFINDVQEGEEKVFFESGQLASLSHIKEGKLHGTVQNWTPEGVLIFEGQYVAGLRHGSFNKFYEDGTPRLAQNYVDDQLHGKKLSYDKNGLVSEASYEHGKKL